MEEEARLSRAAWAQSMDACDQTHSEGILLRTTVMAQQSEIAELQAADRRTQTVISELLKADYRRQRQLVETLKIVKSLKAQMIEMRDCSDLLRNQQSQGGATRGGLVAVLTDWIFSDCVLCFLVEFKKWPKRKAQQVTTRGLWPVTAYTSHQSTTTTPPVTTNFHHRSQDPTNPNFGHSAYLQATDRRGCHCCLLASTCYDRNGFIAMVQDQGQQTARELLLL
ncbi:hypothetical protein Tco_0344456 [Tanacetum coccineum]